ncbi:MAG: hypothetical protein COA45_08025 [Zetaproteobacteria bacterium]|nr:MAG: hypothetical protein COA45_08025 [Zetaproteobacteria bacterium]
MLRIIRDQIIKIPIKKKLTLIMMGLSLLVLISSVTMTTFQAVNDKRNSLVDTLTITAQIVSASSTAPIMFDDQDAARESLETLHADQSIITACIYNASFDLFAEYTAMEGKYISCEKKFNYMPEHSLKRNYHTTKELLEGFNKTVYEFQENHLEIINPITVEGRTIGILYLKSDLSKIKEFLIAQIISAAIITTLMVFLILFLTRRLQRLISDPILNLTKVAQEVSQTQNYELRAQKETEDELGILADSFNEMMEVIRQHESAMRQSERSALEAKKEAVESMKEAKKANSAKSEFLANMSHELRTPMNSILGLTHMILADETLEAEHKELLDIVYQSSSSLLYILNDILDLSKIESKALVLEEIPFDLCEVVSRITDGLAPLASEKGLTLNINYEDETVLQCLMGDPTRVGRILTNLIGNAIKYTKKGTVDLNINYAGLCDDTVEIIISIEDTGIGIVKEKHDLIFDKFSQADASTTRNYGGTGLGLTITKQLIEMMNGRIYVESELGVGSVFTAIIPFKIAKDVIIEEQSKGSTKKIKYEKNRIPVKDFKVLVAEDHALNQIFIQKLLDRLGFQAHDLAQNGVEALDALKVEKYDLLLTDCHMPRKNGYDLTKDIRKQEKKTNVHIPVVAMTANAMIGDREKCLECGMDDYVSKPIGKQALAQVLSRWVLFPESEANGDAVTPKNSNHSPIDMAYFKEFTEGDKDTERGFIDIFIKQSEESMQVLSENCVDGENECWKESAHKLKGGAAMIGAEKLRALCAGAQEMGVSSADNKNKVFKEISAAFEEVKEYLAHLND